MRANALASPYYRVHNKSVEIEYDLAKSERNEVLRGLPFSLVAAFDFDTALIAPDTRETYGEDRYIAVGSIEGRLHVVAYTVRGLRLRVISFRKANAREARRYEQARS